MQNATSNVMRFEHPGRGSRARSTPTDREAQLQAKHEIAALLGSAPCRRDMLIEYLHLIQDTHHQISAPHLAALADEMRLAYAEVHETATSYAHFDVVKEDEPNLTPTVVRVCSTVTCAMFGAETLYEDLKARQAGGALPGARVMRAPCVGLCHHAPVAEVGRNFLLGSSVETVAAAVAVGDMHTHVHTSYVDYDAYVAGGGYALLERIRSGEVTVGEVLTKLDEAGLHGMGGAGFPVGRKWRAVRNEPGPRMMAVNGNEGEPGTLKDGHYLSMDPHRFLEGMLIGAHVVEAADSYIYLRDDYPVQRAILIREIAKLPPGGPRIHLRRGAGACICGEESSMLESIEGKRGLPRHKPPYPYQVGLFGRPTLINGIETLYWVRELVERGGAWWNSHGRNGRTGLRSYSVSGRVRQPGVKLAPAGLTVQELINEHCGGMADGHSLAGYLPGGASGGILPGHMNDIPLDFGTLEKYGCFMGSAAVVILSEADDISSVALNLMRFFEDESCGQCAPCRTGTRRARVLMEQGAWNKSLLWKLSQVMLDASTCSLGQAGSNLLTCLVKYFPHLLTARRAAE